jgi:C-terminal processing protease CtpA/Prc
MVIDLRDNGGGLELHTYMLLQRLMEDTIIIQVSNNHQNEMFGSAKYTIKPFSSKEKNYSFTVIVNEKSASATLVAASILKDSFDADIIGREPMFKKAENIEYLQLPDGTLITLTKPDYSLLNKDGIRVDDSILVDQTMTDEEIDEFLESLRD